MSDTWSWQFNPLLRPVQTYDAPGEHRFFAPMRTTQTTANDTRRIEDIWQGSDGGWEPTTTLSPTISTGNIMQDIAAVRNNPGLLNAIMSIATGPLGLLSVAAGTAASAATGVPGVNTLGGYLMDRLREMGLTSEQIQALREAQTGQGQAQVQLSMDRQTTQTPLSNISSVMQNTPTTLTNISTQPTTSTTTPTTLTNISTQPTTTTTQVTPTTGDGLLNVTQPTTESTTQTNAAQDYINSLYQDLFNRPADQEGLNYWSNLYNQKTQDQLRQDIINGARGDDIGAYLSKFGSGLLNDGGTTNATASTVGNFADLAESLAAEVAEGRTTLDAAVASMASLAAQNPAQAMADIADKMGPDVAAAMMADIENAMANPDETSATNFGEAVGLSDASKSEAAAAAANAAANAAAAMADASKGESDASDAGEGGEGDSGDGGGDGDGGGGDGGGDGGYRRGGLVKGKKTNSPVKTTVHVGEYVVRPEAVNKYGLGLLNAINEQRIPKRRFAGLLGD